MPRPVKKNETVSVHTTSGKVATSGHVITVYADYAVWDETAGKFINTEDTKRG